MAKKGRYGIDVFCKHFSITGKKDVPAVVGEIGPGPNKAAGLAALMLGAKQYLSFEYSEKCSSNREDNFEILMDIRESLKNGYRPKNMSPKAVAAGEEPPFDDTYWGPNLPGDIHFPYYYPQILDDLDKSTLDDRFDAVARALNGDNNSEASIDYIPAWLEYEQTPNEDKFDFVWSHACFEHVEDPIDAYCVLTSMMKVGGVQSHQIDHTVHGMDEKVNGHYAWTRPFWEKRCASKGDGKINCLPPSFHRALLTCFNNKITYYKLRYAPHEMCIHELAKDTLIPESEKYVAGTFIQAMRM